MGTGTTQNSILGGRLETLSMKRWKKKFFFSNSRFAQVRPRDPIVVVNFGTLISEIECSSKFQYSNFEIASGGLFLNPNMYGGFCVSESATKFAIRRTSAHRGSY